MGTASVWPSSRTELGSVLDGGGDLVDAVEGLGVEGISAGGEERRLPQAHHQAARFQANFDLAVLDLLLRAPE